MHGKPQRTPQKFTFGLARERLRKKYDYAETRKTRVCPISLCFRDNHKVNLALNAISAAVESKAGPGLPAKG